MRLGKSKEVSVDEENPYWMSFSDIMSALLVIFILASVILILQLMEIQKELKERQVQFEQELVELKKAEQVRRTILDEAVEALRKRGIKVEVSENHTVLSIPNDLLGFDTGAYDIHAAYQARALEIGKVINEVISREDRVEFLDTIFIEGHTDNRPLQGFMGKGNWGLSTFRAISLWQFWGSALSPDEQLARLKNKDGKPLFSVSGYGETRPVLVDQQTEDDFKRNRRIDIRFTIRRPDSAQYEQVRERLEELKP
ncbi:TPA: OmpA family protein [Pseudomonas aeruginosa]|jgi:flagellar motor protein MotB|uniref:Chemotaxis protein MotB n=3 Tax=Pseudomonas aeruginosa group TaxID=136841 RepID=A0A140SG85_PSEAI|nr:MULTISPECIES: OmpA family protein [Pseudomonadaceae]EQL43277.1 chemotaxis protein MotB [Pseudomonas aeruginosa VRFPA03]EVT82481.1 chemotaxis protein MotB [Pseudomonas aeruginosa VRFPA09]KEA10736.1 chemotaxis protein MotB [Pseudomonas aeruginosa C2773C]CDI94248.1 flagellar motor protein [Pseudomonas aeruginosa PA38182]SCZ11363.1 flagellar motor protein MotS [Acinetobacter baumannii]